MNKDSNPSESARVSDDEKGAMLYVKGIKEFYDHAFMYVIFACVFGFSFGFAFQG